ncbi:serine/threonine-protein kinase [Paenibacillus sp. RS8]|uniref:serine/threonine-protein kinase n=1 Tax=Paenibacillus sp. RS8 TaxID=3242681 RepID=UPI0035BF996E
MFANIIEEDVISKELSYLGDIKYLTKGGQKLVYTCTYQEVSYALKLVPLREDLGDERIENMIIRRAEREINIMEKITSPFFVKLGPTEPGIYKFNDKKYYCYIEQLIDGEPLNEVIKRRSLDNLEATTLAQQIVSVIKEFTENHYIHRDIKPNNIMMLKDSFILLDAGVAYDQSDVSSITKGFRQPGTDLFMSPEQLVETGREIDFRSDLFSLGVVLYMTLTRMHPFITPGLNETQVIAAILQSAHKPIDFYVPHAPKKLTNLVNRFLAKRPHLRYKNCDLIISEINSIKEELE